MSLSCGNAIAEALEESYGETVEMPKGDLECPECHQMTLRAEGKCFTCDNCGYNACS